jgi:hypothetical protein
VCTTRPSRVSDNNVRKYRNISPVHYFTMYWQIILITSPLSPLPCEYSDVYTLGCVDIGIRTTVRLGKVLFVAKVCKICFKTFLVHWPLPHRCTLLGPCSTYGSKMIFVLNIGFMGIKKRRILRRFQKYKLLLVTKST